ncbi:MAG: ThuA domain-containing protein [Chloroflexota bacterium]
MKRRKSWLLLVLALLALALLPAIGTQLQARAQTRETPPPPEGEPSQAPPGAPIPLEDTSARVLLVTATAGFHHDSIPAAQEVVQRLGQESGAFAVALLPDVDSLATLSAELLAGYDAVVFANTSGELPLDETQKHALLDFVATGGGFLGTHSASDTFYTWPSYGELLGAYFQVHPWTQEVDVRVEDPQHPLTGGLGQSFGITEEIYVFRDNPRPRVRVLLSLDASSVGTEGDFPLAWCSRYGAGRVFYNALGHFASTWEDPRFQQHLLAALRWATGRASAPCDPPA